MEILVRGEILGGLEFRPVLLNDIEELAVVPVEGDHRLPDLGIIEGEERDVFLMLIVRIHRPFHGPPQMLQEALLHQRIILGVLEPLKIPDDRIIQSDDLVAEFFVRKEILPAHAGERLSVKAPHLPALAVLRALRRLLILFRVGIPDTGPEQPDARFHIGFVALAEEHLLPGLLGCQTLLGLLQDIRQLLSDLLLFPGRFRLRALRALFSRAPGFGSGRRGGRFFPAHGGGGGEIRQSVDIRPGIAGRIIRNEFIRRSGDIVFFPRQTVVQRLYLGLAFDTVLPAGILMIFQVLGTGLDHVLIMREDHLLLRRQIIGIRGKRRVQSRGEAAEGILDILHLLPVVISVITGETDEPVFILRKLLRGAPGQLRMDVTALHHIGSLGDIFGDLPILAELMESHGERAEFLLQRLADRTDPRPALLLDRKSAVAAAFVIHHMRDHKGIGVDHGLRLGEFRHRPLQQALKICQLGFDQFQLRIDRGPVLIEEEARGILPES